MREVDFLPQWYVRLHQARRNYGRLLTAAIGAAALTLAVQCGTWWAVGRQTDTLDRLRQTSARLTAAGTRERSLLARRELLQAQLDAWRAVACPVSTVALAHKLAAVVPSRMTLTTLKLGQSERAPASRVTLSGLAADDVDVAALLLSLNGDKSFDRIQLGPIKDQRLGGQLLRKFDVTFVAGLDPAAVTP